MVRNIKDLLIHPKNKIPVLDTVRVYSEGKGTAEVSVTNLMTMVTYTLPYAGVPCNYLVEKDKLRALKGNPEFAVSETGLTVNGELLEKAKLDVDDFPYEPGETSNAYPVLHITDWKRFFKDCNDCIKAAGGEKILLLDKSVFMGSFEGKPFVLASSNFILAKIDTAAFTYCGGNTERKTRVSGELTGVLMQYDTVKALSKLSMSEVDLAVSGVLHAEHLVLTGEGFRCVAVARSMNSLPDALGNHLMNDLVPTKWKIKIDRDEVLKRLAEFKADTFENRKEADSKTLYALPFSYAKLRYTPEKLEGVLVDPVCGYTKLFSIPNKGSLDTSTEEKEISVQAEPWGTVIRDFGVDCIDVYNSDMMLKMVGDDRGVLIMKVKVC